MALTDQQHQYLVHAIETLRDEYKYDGTSEQILNDAAVVMTEGFLELIEIASRLEVQPEINISGM